MYDVATQAKIHSMRMKAVQGTLSKAEMVEAALLLTEGRRSAAAASTTASKTRTKARATAANLPSGDDLLAEMLS